MDAYPGYNYIKMHHKDEDKMAFIIDREICRYKVMPFGLKNARATFQRMVNKVFKKQTGHFMDVYVDDMLVKSLWYVDDLQHLSEAFNRL